MSDDKLVRMANQIAANLAVRPGDEPVAGVAQHISDYWDPRMRGWNGSRRAGQGWTRWWSPLLR